MLKIRVGASDAKIAANSKMIAAVFCACATSLCVSSAYGASAQGTLGAGAAMGALANNGFLGVRAYSTQNNAVNTTVTPSVRLNNNPTNPLPAPPNQMLNTPGYYVLSRSQASILVPTGMFVPNPLFPNRPPNQIFNRLTPIASLVNNQGPGALNKSSLKMANDQYMITSTTGQYTGMARAFINAAGARMVSASAMITGQLPPQNGNATGQVNDPIDIPAGDQLPYAPTVSGDVDLDSSTESGGVVFYAEDSNSFTTDTVDNFENDGDPLNQTLWYLSLGASDVTTNGTATVNVDFELNPAELGEISLPPSFVSSLGSFSTPTAEAGLIDAEVDSLVTSDLTVTGDEVDLPSGGLDLLPVGSMFDAPAGADDEFGDGVAASVEVPEPAPGLMFLAVGGAAMLCRWRRSTRVLTISR